MRGFTILFVSAVLFQSSLALKNLELPRWKSFRDAEQECADYLFITNETLERYRCRGYPDEPSVRKLLNCVETNLNAWDDSHSQIKDYVFKQFFVPNTVDCDNVKHTQECLDRYVVPLDRQDRLGRAYQTFQCYYRHYAGISDEVKWVPFHFSEVIQIVGDCLRIVPQCPEALVNFCKGNLPPNPGYPNAVYCSTVRLGLYNKTTGVDFQKLYVQFGDDELLDDDTRECVKRVEEQHCKEPERLVHALGECLLNYLPFVQAFSVSASNLLGNPPHCGIPPSPPPKTQPRYNAHL
ncbi:uncharacterized protein LOC134210066 [Armigeres subalbatus]|uniref:uncharacterized protein LOC134210066 n=1 Tax=Armigeres subalbatus TaxID=124917 RepID=UPI002ED6BECF